MIAPIRFAHPRLFATAGPKLVYIPWKTKEEILALHEEDATRWNTSTLSTRFSAPRENVEAILRLGEIRKEREKMLQSLEQDKRERIVKARDRAIGEWNKLVESVPSASTRAPARPSKLDRTAADISKEANAEEPETRTVSNQEKGDLEESESVGLAEVKKSAWAEYVERAVDKFDADIERKTTYAFVEVGDEKNVQRAVWIREGSGKMRIANEAERRLLLNEEGARDSTAWQ